MKKTLFHVLLDRLTNSALCIGTNSEAMIFLRECTPDTYCVFFVNHPYKKAFSLRNFFRVFENQDRCIDWKWDGRRKVFKRAQSRNADMNLIMRSRLARAKERAISRIMRKLSIARFDVATGVTFQEKVYLEKQKQAEAFRNSGYDEGDVINYPYVLQYADIFGITLRQSADSILLRAKLDDAVLMKTEGVRLLYFDRVKQAKMEGDLRIILKDFARTNFINLQIRHKSLSVLKKKTYEEYF